MQGTNVLTLRSGLAKTSRHPVITAYSRSDDIRYSKKQLFRTALPEILAALSPSCIASGFFEPQYICSFLFGTALPSPKYRQPERKLISARRWGIEDGRWKAEDCRESWPRFALG